MAGASEALAVGRSVPMYGGGLVEPWRLRSGGRDLSWTRIDVIRHAGMSIHNRPSVLLYCRGTYSVPTSSRRCSIYVGEVHWLFHKVHASTSSRAGAIPAFLGSRSVTHIAITGLLLAPVLGYIEGAPCLLSPPRRFVIHCF